MESQDEVVAAIRAAYAPGDRVRLRGFGEPERSRVVAGAEGTVTRVDDAGTVHVLWDNGARLGCVVRTDEGRAPDQIERVRA